MIEVATLLKETINKSAAEEFRHCVDHMPHGASWYVVSDYCFDDSHKEADVATFSVIPNHDKAESILEYLRTFAPKDIKGSRTSSYGFLQYVNLPIVFHFSFVLRKGDDYLKGIMPMARIREYLTEIADFTRGLQANSPTRHSYFDAVLTRISAFERDLERKSFSQRLGRKVILTSILCGMVCYYLALFNQAGHIALVPDRDAMTSAYDGLYYDFAFALFTREYGNTVISDKTTLDKPTFHFVVPYVSGKTTLMI